MLGVGGLFHFVDKFAQVVLYERKPIDWIVFAWKPKNPIGLKILLKGVCCTLVAEAVEPYCRTAPVVLLKDIATTCLSFQYTAALCTVKLFGKRSL